MLIIGNGEHVLECGEGRMIGMTKVVVHTVDEVASLQL
jgi:hypothetical protein